MGGYGIRPYETTEILLTLLSFRPKKNGPQKRNAHRRRSLPSVNTGRAPSGMGPTMFAPTQWGIKNLFQKGFCGAFSKKSKQRIVRGDMKTICKFSKNMLLKSKKSKQRISKSLEYELFSLRITNYQTLNLIQTILFLNLAVYTVFVARDTSDQASK